jgi:hypothetical protein
MLEQQMPNQLIDELDIEHEGIVFPGSREMLGENKTKGADEGRDEQGEGESETEEEATLCDEESDGEESGEESDEDSGSDPIASEQELDPDEIAAEEVKIGQIDELRARGF